jgi:hypothetical protein
MLNLAPGFADEPAELAVVVAGVFDPPPQPAKIAAATKTLPPTKTLFGNSRIRRSLPSDCWWMVIRNATLTGFPRVRRRLGRRWLNRLVRRAER